MDAQSGNIATPAGRFSPEVGQVLEVPALEEALPGRTGRCVPPWACPCGWRTRAGSVMKPLCWEYSRKPRVSRGCKASAPGNGGGEVVDDQVFGDAAEELPGRFQAGDHFFQLLAVDRPQEAVPEAVPRVGQHHQ